MFLHSAAAAHSPYFTALTTLLIAVYEERVSEEGRMEDPPTS